VAAAGDPSRAGAIRAAWLGGAAEALLTAISGVLEPAYRILYEELRRDLPARLGDGAFAAEWAAGQQASMEDAIVAALVGERGPMDLAAVAGPGPRRPPGDGQP
jgi:hypothetical protein